MKGQRRFMFQRYSNRLSVSINRKGVIDVDTVKGCTHGMTAHPMGGCYGLCYANKIASAYGYDFPVATSRKPLDVERPLIERQLKKHEATWFRIGTMGDPCHDWENTIEVCEWLHKIKIPVIVTKHWIELTTDQLIRLVKCNVVINTSISALDTKQERIHRITQFDRVHDAGLASVLRIVSAHFGNTKKGKKLAAIQDQLFKYAGCRVIDNPLRIPSTDPRVISGDIVVEKRIDIEHECSMSITNPNTHIGPCSSCPDQCGVPKNKQRRSRMVQSGLFTDTIEFVHVAKVLDSEFATDIAKLAIEDGVAYRAARKNMQIHSAIVMKINGQFCGFFTFQINHHAKEFCLLQSAMKAGYENVTAYKQMVREIIKENTFNYPMILTCSTEHPLERPDVFEEVGFQTYLELSGYAYMVHGTLEQVRMKRLAHATMTNAWTTTRADWLRMKREWNKKIDDAGVRHNIPNPRFASRDGCWQGENGCSNVVLTKHVIEDDTVKTVRGKSLNGNASVLDPVACDVIVRFFMPSEGRRIYNPFGGGVQFGFVSASYGYEYLASEIRQNQCDANNAICSDLFSAKWIKSDSSRFVPEGKFDLCFTCPPYYKVEEYLDYNGEIPDGELNSMPTYEVFRDTLFRGYEKAISVLDDNRFFVVMTGDSRDKYGAYYGCEAEHELFFKNQGLHIYNKIIYLECEFTRLAHAKRTLDYRKFPKREQKILVFFKGDMGTIKSLYPPVGRL